MGVESQFIIQLWLELSLGQAEQYCIIFLHLIQYRRVSASFKLNGLIRGLLAIKILQIPTDEQTPNEHQQNIRTNTKKRAQMIDNLLFY